MLGNILEINDNSVIVQLAIDINEQPNLVNLHLVFEDDTKKIILIQSVYKGYIFREHLKENIKFQLLKWIPTKLTTS